MVFVLVTWSLVGHGWMSCSQIGLKRNRETSGTWSWIIVGSLGFDNCDNALVTECDFSGL
jgi:hypothetical protein